MYCPGGWGGHSGFPSDDDDDASDDIVVVEAPEGPEGSTPHEPESSAVLLQDSSAESDVSKAGPSFIFASLPSSQQKSTTSRHSLCAQVPSADSDVPRSKEARPLIPGSPCLTSLVWMVLHNLDCNLFVWSLHVNPA